MSLMTKKSIGLILKNYSLGKLESFKIIPIGVSGENYKIKTTRGIFFLKKHRMSANDRISFIEKIQIFFNSHNIPVVCPIENNDGALHSLESGYCYVIYPFVSGKSFKSNERVPDHILENMGSMLAQIHLLTKSGIKGDYGNISKYFIPKDTQTYIKKIDELLEKISGIKNKSAYDKNAYRGLILKKQLFLRDAPSIQNFPHKKYNLGHSDLHSGNMFFNKHGDITAIFDFDTSGPIPRIYDLVTSMMHTCFSSIYTPTRLQKAKIFLKSYHQRYPFSKTELRQAIDMFYIKSLSVWQEKAHYLEHNFRADSDYIWAIKGIHYLEKNRTDLVNELYSSITP